jgi:isopenicillin-N epimerase
VRWERELECQPVDFLGRRAGGLLWASRSILAEYLGTEAGSLAYVTNTTMGVNVIARSLELKPGDEVLSTDHEYGAMERTWKYLAKQRGFKYGSYSIPLPVTSRDEFIDHFWAAVTPATRVIYLSHITSPTAMILPVDEICRRARQAGILTVIDGAHAPGQIDLALDALGADFYVGNLHKWQCAPKGSGFIYARPEVQALIEPLVVSWGYESDHPGPSRLVDLVESLGTRDIAAFLAVPDAIQFMQDHNWSQVRRDCHQLAAWLRAQLCKFSGEEALYPDSTEWYSQMGTAPLPAGMDIHELASRLYQEYNIEVPIVGWKDHKLVRFSIQAYNTSEDAAALMSALKQIYSTN